MYGERPCLVGCVRPAEAGGLCKSCAGACAKSGRSVEYFLATRPLARQGFGTCIVRVCARMAEQKRTRLCGSHQRRGPMPGDRTAPRGPLTARAIYTSVDVVPLSDLPPAVVTQVMLGYQAQLRDGGRLNPSQVKSAILWLADHEPGDLRTAQLPEKGAATTYLRNWQRSLLDLDADPQAEHTRTVIRLHILNPAYRGKGSVDLSDIHAPWLLHLAQQHVLQLAASGASSNRLHLAGYAARWFAMFLRTLAGEGRQPTPVGRTGMTAYLRWLAARARDTNDYQQLSDDDPARHVIAARLLPSLTAGPEPLLVTPQRHYQLVRSLRDILEQGRSWLAGASAADVHLVEQDVPPFPERDDTCSELEGRSQDALQVLMSHQEPSTTQTYYRVSHPRRIDAVRAIAARYRFDLADGRVRPATPGADLDERVRAGVGSVPVPAGQCHEMNNVRADGHGCPVYYRLLLVQVLHHRLHPADRAAAAALRQSRTARPPGGRLRQRSRARAAHHGATRTPTPGDHADRRAHQQVRGRSRLPERGRQGDRRCLAPQQGPVRRGHPRGRSPRRTTQGRHAHD